MAEHSGTWLKKLSEATVIVASILLAFAIDAGWDRRVEAALELERLLAVAEEVDLNRAALRRHLEGLELGLSGIDRFLSSTPEQLAGTSPDSVYYGVFVLPNAPSFNPVLDASYALAQSDVRGERGKEVRRLVSRSLRLWDDAQEGHELLSDLRAAVRGELARYAAREASQGRDNIPLMVARGGAEVLAEMRQDEDLLVLIVQKAHTQLSYYGELHAWLALLDEMAAVLRPDS